MLILTHVVRLSMFSQWCSVMLPLPLPVPVPVRLPVLVRVPVRVLVPVPLSFPLLALLPVPATVPLPALPDALAQVPAAVPPSPLAPCIVARVLRAPGVRIRALGRAGVYEPALTTTCPTMFWLKLYSHLRAPTRCTLTTRALNLAVTGGSSATGGTGIARYTARAGGRYPAGASGTCSAGPQPWCRPCTRAHQSMIVGEDLAGSGKDQGSSRSTAPRLPSTNTSTSAGAGAGTLPRPVLAGAPAPPAPSAPAGDVCGGAARVGPPLPTRRGTVVTPLVVSWRTSSTRATGARPGARNPVWYCAWNAVQKPPPMCTSTLPTRTDVLPLVRSTLSGKPSSRPVRAPVRSWPR